MSVSVCVCVCVNMFGQELPSRPDTELTFTLFPTDAELVTENNKNSFNFAFVCLCDGEREGDETEVCRSHKQVVHAANTVFLFM